MTALYCAEIPAGSSDRAVAHTLLQAAVEHCWGWDSLPAVECGQRGKPYFSGYPDRHFNLSHSGRWAVCALSNRPVGIDLQEERHTPSPVVRKFTPEEQAFLTGQPPERFYALWVKKEAYLKWIGAGLTRPLSSFSVLPLMANQPEDGVWNRQIPFPDGAYQCALCSETPPETLWHQWKGDRTPCQFLDIPFTN